MIFESANFYSTSETVIHNFIKKDCDNMMNKIGKIKFSILENIYDVVRIVEPIFMKAIIIKDNNKIDFSGTCYDFWKKDSVCGDCISMRAYNQNEALMKIEYINNKVILTTAVPFIIRNNKYIIELLKDISSSGITFKIDEDNEFTIGDLIDDYNQMMINHEFTSIFSEKNKTYYSMSLCSDDTTLKELDIRIEKLRDKLNGACKMADDNEIDENRLFLSRSLDKLIVDYMKQKEKSRNEEFSNIIYLNNR